MAGVSVNISLRGVREVRNLLNRYGQAVGGKRGELHQRYGIQALNWINRNFQIEGGLLSSGPWAKLKPNTIAGRRKGSSKILQDTGQMRQGFTMQFSDQQVAVGTAIEVAKFHEKGTAPYTIKPVRAKALAFAIAEGGARVTQAVAMQSARSGSGRFRKGQQLAFAKEVHHPGLPPRRMLPTEPELMPQLLRTTINFLNELKRKGEQL